MPWKHYESSSHGIRIDYFETATKLAKLFEELRIISNNTDNLLGLKSVVCSPVVQVVTQTANNQTETFQITHKLIHTSSLLKRNNMSFTIR